MFSSRWTSHFTRQYVRLRTIRKYVSENVQVVWKILKILFQTFSSRLVFSHYEIYLATLFYFVFFHWQKLTTKKRISNKPWTFAGLTRYQSERKQKTKTISPSVPLNEISFERWYFPIFFIRVLKWVYFCKRIFQYDEVCFYFILLCLVLCKRSYTYGVFRIIFTACELLILQVLLYVCVCIAYVMFRRG